MPLERSPFGSSAQPATAVPVTHLLVETCGKLAGLFQACLRDLVPCVAIFVAGLGADFFVGEGDHPIRSSGWEQC